MSHIYIKRSPLSKNRPSVLQIIFEALLKRKLLLMSLLILFITLPILYLVYRYQPKVEAAWYNDSWLYRTTMTIGNTGSADSNKKVKFDIDTATFYSNGKIQIDCGDSRFTDINGRVLKYYIDSANGACNTNSTDYYVLVSTINSGNTVIYYYYGNPSAANGTQSSQFSEATFTPTSGPTAGGEEQSQGPVANWKFDEGYGTAIQDSTQNNNDGSISSATWQSEDQCVSGKCLSFDGSNDLVTITNSNSLKTSTLTFSAWFKHNGTCSGTWCGVVERLGGSTSTNANRILVTANSNLIVQDSGTVTRLTSNTTFSSGQWYFIEVIISDGVPTLYVNGALDKAGTAGTFSTGTNDIYIGRGSVGASTYWFAGKMDDVKIYPYARSAAQIKSDYASRSSVKGTSASLSTSTFNKDTFSNGLVGYWKMDEATWSGALSEVVDSSGNANHGQAQGATGGKAYPTTAKFANGGYFDGVDDYVQLSSPISFPSDFTLSTWVNLQSKSTHVFFGNNQVYTIFSYISGQFRFGHTAGGSSFGSTTISNGTWNHLAVSVNRTTNVATLFVNGNASGTVSTVGMDFTITNSKLQFLGRDYYSDGTDNFKGTMDEARVYNRALSPKEVRDLYNWAPSPIAHFTMDEGSDIYTYDKSGNGLTATLTNGPVWATGKFGKGISFNAANNTYATFTGNTPFSIAKSITVGLWFKDGDAGSYIFSSSGGGVYMARSGNNVGFRTYIGGANDCSSTSSPLVDNNWHYYSLTYDGSIMRGYVDGKQECTANTYTGSLGSTATEWQIGRRPTTGAPATGVVDDFKVYNYARTQKQIVEDMNAGHPSVGSPVGSAVVYYKFDEGYSTTANNSGSSGTSTNGTISGATWFNSGKYGKALDFDPDKDAMVNLGSSSSLNETSGLTFSTWLYTDAYTESWPTLYQRGTQSGVAGFIWIYQNSGSLNYQYANGTTVITITSGCGLTTNTWQYVSLVHDRDNKKIICYVNGVLKDTDTYTDTALTATTGTAYFGTYQGSTANSYHLNGRLDETKIYNYALTEDEIKLDYNRGAAMVLGSLSDTSGLSGGSVASNSASAEYCIPGDTTSCNSPVAEWKMDEGSGLYAQDTSGNGNTGTLDVGTSAPTWTPGKIGKGLKFDGVDDRVTFSGITLTDTHTVSMWIYPIPSSDDYGALLSNAGTIGLFYRGGSRKITYFYSGTNHLNTTALTENQWHHVEIVNSGGNVTFYLDGKADGTAASATGYTATRMGNDDYSENFKGSIDQVQVYNYARTAAQITWDYNRGKPVGWWKMDECQGVVAYDSADLAAGGSGNNGTITIGGTGTNTSAGTCTGSAGEAWKDGATGKYNSSLEFDGTNDYVNNTSLSGTALDFDNKSLISISLWAKISGGADDYLIELPEGSSGSNGQGIQYNSGNIYFHIITHSDSSLTDVSTSVSTDQWYMLTLTYDGTTLKGYKDGKFIGSHDVVLGTGLFHAAKELNIGRFGTWGGYFNGQIDDVRIYNYGLTATQVKSLYNEGSAVRFGPATGSP